MSGRKEQDLLYVKNTNRWKNDLILSAEKLADKTKLNGMNMNTIAYHKATFISTLETEDRTVFEIMTDEEKEKIWKIIENDIPCLLELAKTVRGDVFPEKAFNYATLHKILSNGKSIIMPNFVHSQFYRKGMREFLISEKYRQLIMDKIGTNNYLKLMKEISQDKKPAKRS